MQKVSWKERGAQLAKDKREPTPRERAEANGQHDPPPPLPPVEAVQVFYDAHKKAYWVPNAQGEWIGANESALSRLLRSKGHRDSPKDLHGLTPLERTLLSIHETRDVDYAGPLAGYPAGRYDVDALRVLVTKGPRLIKPRRGKWPTLKKFFGELLGDGFAYLVGWLKHAVTSLYAGPPFRPGQALILAGPPHSGKSLCQAIVTEIFGGREAKPYRYMIGETTFNGEMLSAEHLIIADEPSHTDIRSRRHFGHQLKNLCVNATQSIHPKGRQALTLSPFWRLSISLNERPEDLLVLPPLDDETKDKVILLRAFKVAFPFKADDREGWMGYRRQLSSELPGFLHALQAWKIPPRLQDQRFGVQAFLDADLLAEVDQLSPELRLLGLIDTLGIVTSIFPVWEGTAADLERELFEKSKHGEVERLITFNTAVGVYLGRLVEKCPDRVQKVGSGHKARRWKIVWEGV